MCCYGWPAAKQRLLVESRKNRRKTFTGWKIVSAMRNSTDGFDLKPLCGAYDYRYRAGDNYAKTKDGKQRWRGRSYNHERPLGIHVFLSESSVPLWHNAGRVIRVICHIDDLVCASSSEAVFKKVRIPAAEYARAVKGRQRKAR